MIAGPRDDPHVIAIGHAPTPFTADDIRRGCPPGRTTRLLVETTGEPAYIRQARFIECYDEGALQALTRTTREGRMLGTVETVRSTWRELQAHASFPSDTTDIEPDTIETPLGTLDCLRYTIDDGSSLSTFWFANDLPGMPVRFTRRQRDRIISTTTMISNQNR